MKNPKVSVLLCTYNGQQYIKETISSILQQTYRNFEFIIVNDGSTDNTLKIIQEFNDPRINLINIRNSGLTNALNKGVAATKTNWIARMDDDDIAKENRLEIQVRHLTDELAVVGSQCEFIDKNGKKFSTTKLALNHENIIKDGLAFKNMFIHPAVIINKKLLVKCGGYDPLIEAAEDLDLWLKLSTLGELKNIDENLLEYRIHDNKVSNKKRGIQILNAEIAIEKFKEKNFQNITVQDYKRISNKIENNFFFRILRKLSVYSVDFKGFSLKIFNLNIKFLRKFVN